MALAHLIISLLAALVGLSLLGLSLLVFDMSQALFLGAYLLVLPIVSIVFWPSFYERVAVGRQAAIWVLLFVPLVLVPLLNEQTSLRMVVMAEAIAGGYVQSFDGLLVTYREMPPHTARFPLTLPNGDEATLGRHWNYVTTVEQARRP